MEQNEPGAFGIHIRIAASHALRTATGLYIKTYNVKQREVKRRTSIKEGRKLQQRRRYGSRNNMQTLPDKAEVYF
jgi:hypothetical protein